MAPKKKASQEVAPVAAGKAAGSPAAPVAAGKAAGSPAALAGLEAIGSSATRSDAETPAARTGAASLPTASAGAEMSAVAPPPVAVAPTSVTQPSHFRAGPEELQNKQHDVEPLTRQAAAFRVKYRRAGGLICFPLQQVGFHPQNRNGQPPNGERCAGLCEDILALGFDREEAKGRNRLAARFEDLVQHVCLP